MLEAEKQTDLEEDPLKFHNERPNVAEKKPGINAPPCVAYSKEAAPVKREEIGQTLELTFVILVIVVFVLMLVAMLVPERKPSRDMKLIAIGFLLCSLVFGFLWCFWTNGPRIPCLNDAHNRYVASVETGILCKQVIGIMFLLTLIMVLYIVWVAVVLPFNS